MCLDNVQGVFSSYRQGCVQGERGKAVKGVESHQAHIKQLHSGEPGKDGEAKKARGAAEEKLQVLTKLKTEVQAEENRAADLEKQALEARSDVLAFRVTAFS